MQHPRGKYVAVRTKNDDDAVTMSDGKPWSLVPLERMTATQQRVFNQGYRCYQHRDTGQRLWWLVVDAPP